MQDDLQAVRIGLILVMLGLVFGISMGAAFGDKEDSFKSYVAEGVAAHPEVHDEKSKAKIWRYAQRSHFHVTGVAAFTLGLVILVMFSSLRRNLKTISAILVGLGGPYPLSWLAMFLLAPLIGRGAAHGHIIT
jgi:cellobiose-specific phosphotransferase system component IIC